MKVIGFANKFYTLWDVTSKVVESKYSKDTLVTNTYIKNISMDIDKVKEIVYNTMTNVFNLKVPLDVDIELGNNWYEAK